MADKDRPGITAPSESVEIPSGLRRTGYLAPPTTPLDIAAPPLPPENTERSETVRQTIERSISEVQNRNAEASKAQPSSPTELELAKPMHQRDRWLYVVLGWAAIPTSLFVSGIGAFINGSPHWGAGLCVAGLIGMYAVSMHLLEQRQPVPSSPGPILIGIAILSWAFVGWQTWLALRAPSQGYTQTQLDAAVSEAKTSVHSKLEETSKERDATIAERDSARRELANTRQELEAARKSAHVPALQMQANAVDGPLHWNPDLSWGALGTGHGQVMAFVYFRATNVSGTAVQLKDAYILSGLTGAKLPLKVNIPYAGATSIAEINPIPPSATVDLIVEWKEADALPIKEFLNQWGNIHLRVDYDQTVYERTYNSDYLYQKATREFPGEGLGPRVTKKGEK